MNKPIDQLSSHDIANAWWGDYMRPVEHRKAQCFPDLVELIDGFKTSSDVFAGLDSSDVIFMAIKRWGDKFNFCIPNAVIERLRYSISVYYGIEKRAPWSNPICGEFGTAYSVAEARLVARNNMDDMQVKHLILWLCDRVEELERGHK